jgi:hypothetical protein
MYGVKVSLPTPMFLFHLSSMQNISENKIYTKNNWENVFRNFLHAGGVKKKYGVWEEKLLYGVGTIFNSSPN